MRNRDIKGAKASLMSCRVSESSRSADIRQELGERALRGRDSERSFVRAVSGEA